MLQIKELASEARALLTENVVDIKELEAAVKQITELESKALAATAELVESHEQSVRKIEQLRVIVESGGLIEAEVAQRIIDGAEDDV